jgi:hypothetical protein
MCGLFEARKPIILLAINFKGRDRLGDKVIDERIILKRMLKKE